MLRRNKPLILFLRTDSGTVDPRIQKEAGSLARFGYDVHVFGWDRQSEFPREEQRDGITFKRCRIRAPYGSNLLILFLPLFWVRVAWEVLRLRPDVVHSCDLDACIPAAVTKVFLGHRLVYDIFDHFAEKLQGIPPWLRRKVAAFDRVIMKIPDAVIVTDTYRKQLVNGNSLKRVEIVMNVPPDPGYTPMNDRQGVLRLCSAGAIHEHRGLYVTAAAVKGLSGVTTVFAGWAPRQKDAEFVKKEPDITYLGKVPYAEALRLVSGSDVVVALYDPSLPINALASSNKVFEAMAAGRPVITNSETTMAPLVREEQCGIEVPYGDVAKLREAFVMLRDQPALRRRLGDNGRAAFLKKYTWAIMEERLKSLYGDLLSEGAKR